MESNARRRPASRIGKKLSTTISAVDEPSYSPPDFSSSRRRRIGSSFIEQFVAGHDASDVLRELVQNEFDGGGESLALTFGSRALEVVGSGQDITESGWTRLSVIVGTGNVMGGAQTEVVAPKENGIGSKNFGLRSLFRFSDEIHVRSGGQVALLDLQTQETGRERDPAWQGENGVRLYVPYREASTERLEAFTIEREEHAFALMAAGMPDTLLKLALCGKSCGLRAVSVRSIRTGRVLLWRQDAKPERCHLRGITALSRKGTLIDGDDNRASFQEVEYFRSVGIPAEHLSRRFPAYFKVPGGRVKIAVSLPITRRRINLAQQGHFYYPLKAPAARTGCAISVSAPFELNNDRSGINDHVWNDWLIDQLVKFTIDLLKADWFSRFGADAFKSLIDNRSASPDRFITRIVEQLAQDACWPTRAKRNTRFAPASDIVLPTEGIFDGFLEDGSYLDPLLAGDTMVCEMVKTAGAKRFSLSSLIRLRCAGENSTLLETKLDTNAEANFHFTNYKADLVNVDLQKRFAAALSAFPRRLSKEHKADIRNTESTLSATLELKPAAQLMIVEHDLWAGCPEPEANRLHVQLIPYKAIAAHCRTFDEQKWLIDAAQRASSAAPDNRERAILYKKLLTRAAPLSRLVLAALRANPVVKNQRGDWVAPADMVFLRKPFAQILDPVTDAPAREMLNAPGLIARLRIRNVLNGSDIVRFASALREKPDLADRFEKLLANNLRLLSASVVEQLRTVPCLLSRSQKLETPTTLYLDTHLNRVCVGDDDKIVGGTNDLVYRKLKLKAVPSVDTLIETIERHRGAGAAPPRPDVIYPALVAAMAHERRANVSQLPICWVRNSYHAPSTILVGVRVASALAEAIPIYRHEDDTGRAYVSLGAPAHANDAHWSRFFRHVDNSWSPDAPLDSRRRRILLEAYHNRGHFGLPEGLENVRCLMDDRFRLFSLADLRAGRLVEPDFHAVQEALRNANSTLGVIEESERSRPFFNTLGIRPLSSIAGTGEPVFGTPGRPQHWYKAKHSDRILAMMHRPIFARALYEIAYRNRYNQLGFVPSAPANIEARLAAIRDIAFFESIGRRYTVGSISVQVPAEVALSAERIGLVAPKTKNTLQLILAEAFAEIAGATSAAAIRNLANAFLPIVLCRTQDELRDYLDRIDLTGHRHWLLGESDQIEAEADDDHEDDEVEEDALRQVFDSLNTDGATNSDRIEPVQTSSAAPATPTWPSPPPAPVFVLPKLEEVTLTVAPTLGSEIQAREPSSSRGGGGYSGVWLPPTFAEVERAQLVGQRGEELVYRMELQRVRAMGHSEPEQFVIWTSRTEQGADHDIRSIDENGRPRWIEVKSTTGVDGRFDWPRREFEKALRERDRYELWRVFRVADYSPVAKCFRNPARMIGARQIVLELGMLRANIENLS